MSNEPNENEKPRIRPGRTTKLTPEVLKTICDGIEEGLPQKYAAARAGVGESTFYHWLKLGREAKSGKYREFLESIKLAEAECIRVNTMFIQVAAKDSWQAAAWLLERRFPKDYARTEKLEHSGLDGKKEKTEEEIDQELNRVGSQLEALEQKKADKYRKD